ncbi:MAG: APC family permease, partial [Acidobacteria bacterium]|nr:APC family permease [Acidobacteriota bacterium]
AYTAKVFPQSVSFATGWVMLLAYLIVCPWEAVAIGRIAGYIVPALNSIELYRIADRAVYAPHLVIGIGLTAIITLLNYRGVRASATFQNWTTFGLLALFLVFGSLGAAEGSNRNWTPLFSHAPLVSILLTLQIVPYFMTGFEAITKCSEEASPEFRAQGFFRAIFAALLVATVFYAAVIALVAWVHPWPQLIHERMAAAVAFERTFGSRTVVNLILGAALLSLMKVFNGNFLAASRLLFGLGRRGLVSPQFAELHPHHQTPGRAVLLVGALTAALAFLGDAILVPVTEVGSLASATGWLAACAAYLRIEEDPRKRWIASAGLVVSLALIAIKLLPFVPGSFRGYEYIALGLWVLAGVLLRRRVVDS